MKNVNPPPKSSTIKGKGKLIQDVKSGSALEFDKAGMMGFLKSLNQILYLTTTYN